jgi:hypothetical protein
LPKSISTWAGVAALVLAAVVLTFVAVRYVPGWLSGAGVSAPVGVPGQQAAPPEFSRMQLQGQFAGPLQGTVIQRWRDPVDGTICYIYMPMVVQHKSAPSGYVDYGSNFLGSITCMPKTPQAAQ